MPQKILDVLLLGRCSHEFSWPRRAADGEYYQVCLLCASEFRYDWATMRRTERLQKEANSASPVSDAPTPRQTGYARPRIKMETQVRYRVKNLGTWNEGIIENLSQSGVLIGGQQRFPENTLVEMVFEMPEAISGQKNSKVLCQGRIIRMKSGKAKEPELSSPPQFLTTNSSVSLGHIDGPGLRNFCLKIQPPCI